MMRQIFKLPLRTTFLPMRPTCVYNLEFPAYVRTLDIDGYRFLRVEGYETALLGLQHRIDVTYEFNVPPNTGSHQRTAIAAFPEREQPSILPWEADTVVTRLQDILLLLSLFTGRNVFAIAEAEQARVLRPDPREHFYGGDFRLAALVEDKYRNIRTGAILTEDEIRGVPLFDYEHFDAGLEKTVNQILLTISSEDWRREYGDGYCLFLFRQAMQQQGIEPAFILCWTIWEHLFALHNQGTLSDYQIRNTGGTEKITYVLSRYFEVQMTEDARHSIERMTRGRNRLVHFGIRPENVLNEEMGLIIRLTERLMAKVLRLELSTGDVLGTMGRLNRLLDGVAAE